ncbi:MAG: RNase H family protein [Leadbetterella sp.]
MINPELKKLPTDRIYVFRELNGTVQKSISLYSIPDNDIREAIHIGFLVAVANGGQYLAVDNFTLDEMPEFKMPLTTEFDAIVPEIKTPSVHIKPSMGIAVDGSCLGNPGDWQYKVLDFYKQEIIYQSPLLPNGTNNIAEYVALIHAIAYQDKNGMKLPIYTDSQTALAWLRSGKSNSGHTHVLLERSDKWLSTYLFKNKATLMKVEKWHTKSWGENPADFGMKPPNPFQKFSTAA